MTEDIQLLPDIGRNSLVTNRSTLADVNNTGAYACMGKAKGGGLSLGYDPRPTPSLLRVGMKLSDQYLLKTAEPLIMNNTGTEAITVAAPAEGPGEAASLLADA
jgi:hypothetical protein